MPNGPYLLFFFVPKVSSQLMLDITGSFGHYKVRFYYSVIVHLFFSQCVDDILQFISNFTVYIKGDDHVWRFVVLNFSLSLSLYVINKLILWLLKLIYIYQQAWNFIFILCSIVVLASLILKAMATISMDHHVMLYERKGAPKGRWRSLL